MKSVENCPQR